MYNRYIPAAAQPWLPPMEEPSPLPEAPPDQKKPAGGLAALLKAAKLENLDTGDVLLLLILLFLFLEGDDLELIITLGLLLLLGLD